MKILSPSVALLLLSVPAYSDVKLADALVSDVQQYCYETGTTDVWMSWAAVDANIIQAWQDVYLDRADNPAAPANGTGTGLDRGRVVYDAMRACYDQDGYAYLGTGLSHWMQGEEYMLPLGEGTIVIASPAAGTGGYYRGAYGTLGPQDETGLPTNPCFVDKNGTSLSTKTEQMVTNAGLREVLGEAFSYKGHAAGLGITHRDTVTGTLTLHALTCWGYETDASGNICTLYVTDSFDETGVFKVSLDDSGLVRSESGDHLFNKQNFYLKSVTALKPVEGAAAADTSLSGGGNIALSAQTLTQQGVTVSAGRILAAAEDAGLEVQGASGHGLQVQGTAVASLRSLSVTGSSGAGVVAEGRADVQGDTLLLDANLGGGMRVSGLAGLSAAAVQVQDNGSGAGQGGGMLVEVTGAVQMTRFGAEVSFSGNSAELGGAVYNAGRFLISEAAGVTFEGNTAARGAAIYNEGFFSIRDTWGSLSFAAAQDNTVAAPESQVYNSGTMELAWAYDGMEFSGSSYGIDNAGVFYLGVEAGAEAVFRDTALRSSGTMYIGMDAEDSMGMDSAGVVFTSGAQETTLRTVEGEDGYVEAPVLLQGTMDAAGLAAAGEGSRLEDALLVSDGVFSITGVDLVRVRVQLSGSGVAGTLTLSSVGLDDACALDAAEIRLEDVTLFLDDDRVAEEAQDGVLGVDAAGIFAAGAVSGSLTLETPDLLRKMEERGAEMVSVDFGNAAVENLDAVSLAGLQLVGMQGGKAVFRAAAVPEPACPAMLLGALLLALPRRRRR